MTADQLWRQCEEDDWLSWPDVRELARCLRSLGLADVAALAVWNHTSRYGPPAQLLSEWEVTYPPLKPDYA